MSTRRILLGTVPHVGMPINHYDVIVGPDGQLPSNSPPIPQPQVYIT